MNYAADYIKIIDHIFGVSFDATYGFHLQLEEISKQQEEATAHLATQHEKSALIHSMDSKQLTYAISSYEEVAHQTTVREYKFRNWPDGPNYQWAIKMAIVTIYEYWEGHFREKIANSAGLPKKEDLKIDEFGDLCIYRNAILHNLGKGSKDFSRLKVFTWFKHREPIIIDIAKLNIMVSKLKASLASYV